MSAVPRTEFLASVRAVDEAQLAVSAGASIIDGKEPAAGALGALPHAVVSAVRRAVPTHIAVSATVGDLPCEPHVLCQAARAMAATGVQFVKVGLWPGGDVTKSIDALGRLDLGRARLVAVLFADCEPDFALLAALGQAGFAGVMLDTADKSHGSLVDHVSMARLDQFVAQARHVGLTVGLAGSLQLEHIAPLQALRPDILGFRGALCAGGRRKGELDCNAIHAVAHRLGLRAMPAQRQEAEALAS